MCLGRRTRIRQLEIHGESADRAPVSLQETSHVDRAVGAGRAQHSFAFHFWLLPASFLPAWPFFRVPPL